MTPEDRTEVLRRFSIPDDGVGGVLASPDRVNS